MSIKLESLQKVFITQLNDIYNAENQLLDALASMAEAASNQQLETAFRDHLRETKGHIRRLEQIYSNMKLNPSGQRCKAMSGLIEEGEDVISEDGAPEARDAALICAAQKIEHYEIATYGTLREYARLLGHNDAHRNLTETLEEERNADSVLTEIAEVAINKQAMASVF